MLLKRRSFSDLSVQLPRMRPWNRRFADLDGIFIAMFIVYTTTLLWVSNPQIRAR